MKKILVTGASGGMGTAICKALLQNGCTVYGLDLQQKNTVEGLQFIQCDVRDSISVTAAKEEILRRTDSLDAIVHTAGIYDMDSLLELDEERFSRIMDINLGGVYRINKAFVPLMRSGGRIVITSSELAPLDPLPFTGIYAVSKAALEKYAFSLRMEVNLLGISVSVIRPGAVKTGLLGDSTRALDRFVEKTEMYRCNAVRFRKIVNSVEAKNIPPEKIAAAVCRALNAQRPKYVYNINRNPLLRLLNILPDRWQVGIIRQILK